MIPVWLLSWRHSGFSVHTSVTVPQDDGAGLERLARYLLRPPVSLERLHVDEQARTIAYARRAGHGAGLPSSSPPLDPDEFLARVLMHIPEPRLHEIRYCGAYSSVVRARRRCAQATAGAASPPGGPAGAQPPDDPDLRALRHRWAELIRRIYEVDPLVCPRCGGPMRIIAFITQPKVIATILAHLAAKGADGRSPPGAADNQRPAAWGAASPALAGAPPLPTSSHLPCGGRDGESHAQQACRAWLSPLRSLPSPPIAPVRCLPQPPSPESAPPRLLTEPSTALPCPKARKEIPIPERPTSAGSPGRSYPTRLAICCSTSSTTPATIEASSLPSFDNLAACHRAPTSCSSRATRPDHARVRVAQSTGDPTTISMKR
ncbi:MAG: transposase [Acidobacteriia bacterium]|nr:transposase [Terriglobia bacterium]